MKLVLLIVLLFLVGCAPMTPEAELRREDDIRYRNQRAADWEMFKVACKEAGGTAIILREGNYSGLDVARRIPGKNDRVACQSNPNRYCFESS